MSQSELVSRLVLGTSRLEPTATRDLARDLQDHLLLSSVCQSIHAAEASLPQGPPTDANPVENLGPYLQYAAVNVPAVALQFCQELAAKNLTCPLSALPEILALGVNHPEVIRPILGPQGAWLARFDPNWSLFFSDKSTFESLTDAYETEPPLTRMSLLKRLVELNPERAVAFAIERWPDEVAQVRLGMLQAVQSIDIQSTQPLLDLALQELTPAVQSQARMMASLHSEKFQSALEESLVSWLTQSPVPNRMPIDWSIKLLPPATTLRHLGGWKNLTPKSLPEEHWNAFISGVRDAALLHRDGDSIRQLIELAARQEFAMEFSRSELRLLDPDYLHSLIEAWFELPLKRRPEHTLTEAIIALGHLGKEISEKIGAEVVNSANKLKTGRTKTSFKDESVALALHLDVASEVLDKLHALPLSPREHLRKVWIPILHLRLVLLRPLQSLP